MQRKYCIFHLVGNSPPVANNQAVNVINDTQTPITLTATDPDNDPLTYSIVAQPLHGTVAPPGPGTASRTYTPTAEYLGPDSFTFKANDGTVDSNTATVSITVQDTTSCITNLPISGVTASGNDGNLPSNVLDNNLNTRWSSLGVGQFIRADLVRLRTSAAWTLHGIMEMHVSTILSLPHQLTELHLPTSLAGTVAALH